MFYDMTNEKIYDLGIDIGSTTAKVVLTDGESVLYERYERHNSAVREKTVAMLGDLLKEKGDITVKAALSGSAALGLASEAGVAFVQEVYAEGEVVKYKEKGVNCVIELGGEDAKMIFIDKNGGKYEVNAKVVKVGKDFVVAEQDGKEITIKADSVVNAMGRRAHATEALETAIKEAGIPVWKIGDCVRARQIGDAVREGWTAAMEII